jgi:hypothetical protein
MSLLTINAALSFNVNLNYVFRVVRATVRVFMGTAGEAQS